MFLIQAELVCKKQKQLTSRHSLSALWHENVSACRSEKYSQIKNATLWASEYKIYTGEGKNKSILNLKKSYNSIVVANSQFISKLQNNRDQLYDSNMNEP